MIGSRTRVKVVKNKVAPPFREAEFDIMYGKGISHEGEIIDLGIKYDIVKRGGAWFSYGEVRLGQGRDNAKNFMSDNPDIMAEVESKIREAMKAQSVEKAVRGVSKATISPETDDLPNEKPAKPVSKVNIDVAVDE